MTDSSNDSELIETTALRLYSCFIEALLTANTACCFRTSELPSTSDTLPCFSLTGFSPQQPVFQTAPTTEWQNEYKSSWRTEWPLREAVKLFSNYLNSMKNSIKTALTAYRKVITKILNWSLKFIEGQCKEALWEGLQGHVGSFLGDPGIWWGKGIVIYNNWTVKAVKWTLFSRW